MYIDLSNANEAVGKIVYKTHNPKTLYLIESIKQVNPFDVTVVPKEVEKVRIPNGRYACRKSERRPVEVEVPKAEFVIFDHRTSNDDK